MKTPIYNRIRCQLNCLFILLCVLSITPAFANSVRIYTLSADQWARPRAGEVIPQLEPVRLSVAYWETLDNAAILLSYPGEDSGELWAVELRDWLISLGLPSDVILLSPGLQAEDQIQMMVGHRQELFQ